MNNGLSTFYGWRNWVSVGLGLTLGMIATLPIEDAHAADAHFRLYGQEFGRAGTQALRAQTNPTSFTHCNAQYANSFDEGVTVGDRVDIESPTEGSPGTRWTLNGHPTLLTRRGLELSLQVPVAYGRVAVPGIITARLSRDGRELYLEEAANLSELTYWAFMPGWWDTRDGLNGSVQRRARERLRAYQRATRTLSRVDRSLRVLKYVRCTTD